jgi:hypothetical protein
MADKKNDKNSGKKKSGSGGGRFQKEGQDKGQTESRSSER